MKLPSFRNQNIKTKMMTLFILVSIIPVLSIGIIALVISSNEMLDKEIQDSFNSLKFIDYKATEIIDQCHLNTLRVACDESIRTFYDEQIRLFGSKRSSVENEAKRRLMSYYNNQIITSILLLNGDGKALSYSPSDYSSVQEQAKTELVPENNDRFKFFDLWDNAGWENAISVIPYKRIVIGWNSEDPTAYLIVNVRESVFSGIYADYESTGSAKYYMVNESGIIQSCTDKTNFAQSTETMGFSIASMNQKEGYFVQKVSGVKSIVTYTHNAQKGIFFLAITPTSNAYESFIPILILTITIGCICIVLSLVCGVLMSNDITTPLYALIHRISLFEGTNEDGMIVKQNELTILSDKYGEILEHLEYVIRQNYEEQEKKKKAEIKTLEFQINPHFLYNTLATVIWLVENDEKKKAIKMTKKLSSFFRISISQGRQYISIQDEVTHVDLYIDIQKTRYEEKIHVEYHLPSKMMTYYTPKLILQPLVENSIYHGMQERADKTGRIRITGHFDGDDIILEVWDNGDKLTETAIEEMNQFLHNREKSTAGKDYGIGISNVHDRIVMCFGEGYGLSFRLEGQSTVASIRIKALTKGGSNDEFFNSRQ